MINVITLTNINNKIIESKLSKIFISDVCIKLIALRINWYTSSSQFQKVGDPCSSVSFNFSHLFRKHEFKIITFFNQNNIAICKMFG